MGENKKNWTGDRNSIFLNLGSSSHSKGDREVNDYYATEPKATKLLYDIEKVDKNILDPCVGGGHLVKHFINKGHNVYGMDIIDRGFPNTIKGNFLRFNKKFKGDIIMNPPYKYGEEFVKKAISVISEGKKLYAFLKIQFMESKGRFELFKAFPPKRIWVSSSRLSCAKNGEFHKVEQTNSAVSYCWYVWEKGYKGDTKIKWFNP